MKAVKSRGGPTHGRGIDEGVRTVWVQSMHQCASIHMVMANLTGLFRDTSQEHREFGQTRIKRDTEDLKKVID